MKDRTKTILIISGVSLIIAAIAVKTNFIVSESVPEYCHQTYGQDGKRFQYPCNWEVEVDNKGGIVVSSPVSELPYYVIYPAESFQEYEDAYAGLIREGSMFVEEMHVTVTGERYSAKRYSQHGGMLLLIEVGEKHVGVSSERYLNEEELEGLEVILSSLVK